MISGPSEITHIVVDPFILSQRDERNTKFKEIVFTIYEEKKLDILSPILNLQINLTKRRKLLNVLRCNYGTVTQNFGNIERKYAGTVLKNSIRLFN